MLAVLVLIAAALGELDAADGAKESGSRSPR
jgi:hypothetical protein